MTTYNKDEDNKTILEENAMQLTTAMVLPMALKATMDLGVLEIMDRAGPGARLTASETVAQLVPCALNLSHASQMIDHILRLLSSYSVVTCSVVDDDDDGQVIRTLYSLAPLSGYFLHGQDNKTSLASLFHLINDKVMTNVWYHMKDAILEGEVPFNKAYGTNLGDYIGKHETFAPIFKKSMIDFNPMFMNEILDKYKGFEGLKLIVDVGGGNGSILEAIISKYPTIRGINFDLPSVIEKLPIYPGIQNVAGDMFSGIPQGDAIFIKWVLKNMDDGKCLELLKNCFKALPEGGKLIVVELVIPEIPETSISSKSVLQLGLFLTNVNIGGKERTAREFQALAMAAGFSGIQAAIRAYDMTLLEFHKTATN